MLLLLHAVLMNACCANKGLPAGVHMKGEPAAAAARDAPDANEAVGVDSILILLVMLPSSSLSS